MCNIVKCFETKLIALSPYPEAFCPRGQCNFQTTPDICGLSIKFSWISKLFVCIMDTHITSISTFQFDKPNCMLFFKTPNMRGDMILISNISFLYPH